MNLHNDKERFREAIIAASTMFGIEPSLVEKDYFVTLFLKESIKRIPGLVFKGGNYTYSESSEDASYIIMANDMYMANYVINLSNNKINTLEISKNSRFLFIAPKDEEIQNFKAFNNTIGNYNSPKNDYIKNCNVES